MRCNGDDEGEALRAADGDVIDQRTTWGHFGVILGSLWGHFVVSMENDRTLLHITDNTQTPHSL